jgi:hypothetical protein
MTALVVLLAPKFSGAFRLPDSGEKVWCYDSAGVPIFCAGTGQDGAYTINPPSYTDNGDGTVTDNNTGLMWQQQMDDTLTTWSGALAYCSSLTLAGYTDWKLPSKTKLVSIADYGVPSPGPSIHPIFMQQKTHYSGFYTSTPVAGAPPGTAWVVYFASGGFQPDNDGIGYARCVRGDKYPAQNFIDNGGGTVSDMRTGLTWQQGEPGSMLWDAALAYCNGLYLGGHGDWRLPNIKELESLTDNTRWAPAIDTAYFPDMYVDQNELYYYYSSTSDALYGSAWVIDFNSGSMFGGGKQGYPLKVRCVRGNVPDALRVKKSGTGSGTVTSVPAGINCGSDCKQEYRMGKVVTLTATPDFGSVFSGWIGEDPDCADGAVVIDGLKECIANFSSTLRLLSPADKEVVSAGSPYDITWEVLDEAVRFKLFYSIDNKLTWVPITETASGTSYPWTVPALTKNKKAHLKIIGFTADNVRAGTGISDAYFVIEAVTILRPNDEFWPLHSGRPYIITWRTTPTPKAPVESYSLYLTTDNGLTWKLIGSGIGNPGIHSWTPVVKNQSKCRVRIILKDATGATVGIDASDGFFSIR